MTNYQTSETSGSFIDAESGYKNAYDLLAGVSNGSLLVHARVRDDTNFAFGISPSAGEFLRSTEAWMQADEWHGAGPELTFFSDSLDWVMADTLCSVRGAQISEMDVVFVEPGPTIVKYIGNGDVRTHAGNTLSYEMCELANFEDPLMSGVPAGVETGDWFTNRDQDVVAVVPREALILAMSAKKLNSRTPR